MAVRQNCKTTRKLILLCAVVLLSFASIVLLLLLDHNVHHILKMPAVEHGTITFQPGDFEKQKTFLDGDWNFYWQELIVSEPDNNAVPDKMVQLPHMWSNETINDEMLPVGGYASYQITAKGIPGGTLISGYIPNLGGAYRMYANGTLIARSGVLSKNPDKVFATTTVKFRDYQVAVNEDVSIVIECAAQVYSGVYMTPVIGELLDITRSYDSMHLASWILVGMVLLGFINYLVLTISLPGDRRIKWLLAITFLIFLRLLFRAESSTIISDFLGISYERQNVPLFIIVVLLKIMALYFVCSILKVQKSTWVLHVLSVFSILVLIICLVVPRQLYNRGVFLFLPLAEYVSNLYILYKMIGHIKRGGRYSTLMSVTFCVMFVGYGIENLYLGGFFRANPLLFSSAAYITFIILTIVLYARKYARVNQTTVANAVMEKELVQSQMTLMLGQIKPHFLFNTLNTIDYLCQVDVDKARLGLIFLSKFLRGNMNTLGQVAVMPFETELDLVKSYLEIEKLRFEERLTVIYDVQESAFQIPTLCLQTVVENAIKHGLQKKKNGGTVRISTFADEASFYVCVQDDGVGFSADTLVQEKSEAHGLINVRMRLKTLMNATLSLQSEVGRGTVATITIPKEGVDAAL